ncbi:MAG TPA: hypothetical protein VIK37_00195 [Candidatus Saccharimonadales bacterium]
MTFFRNWRLKRRQRQFEVWLQKQLEEIEAGKCTCFKPVPASRAYYDLCPRAPYHRQVDQGFRTFRCSSGHEFEKKDWPLNCSVCGDSTIEQVELDELSTRWLQELHDVLSHAKPLGFIGFSGYSLLAQ